MTETGGRAADDHNAAVEKINPSCVSRVLRLSLLAPEIVEAILDGRQSPQVRLTRLLRPFPLDWNVQSSSITSP